MIKVNDEINVKIEKLSSEGTGIARYDGIVIFVEQDMVIYVYVQVVIIKTILSGLLVHIN